MASYDLEMFYFWQDVRIWSEGFAQICKKSNSLSIKSISSMISRDFLLQFFYFKK